MTTLPMMTKEDAIDLVEAHNDLCAHNPSDRPIYTAAIVQTLSEALREHKTTPELVAYIIEHIFDEQLHEDVQRFQVDPALAIMEMIARAVSESCEEEEAE